GFVAEEGIFEREVLVGGIEPHRFGELIAGGLGFTDFQERVGKIGSDISPIGGERDRLVEGGDGAVVIFGAERTVSFIEKAIGWVGRLTVSYKSQEEEPR